MADAERVTLRIVYPLLWSRPDRKACREQSVNTAAALARRGAEVTLLMPRGRDDPALTAADLRAWFGVYGDFRLVQRPSRWAGEKLFKTLFWLRQVWRDPALAGADLLYSRIPAMLAAGARSPLPFATDHYRPWPDDMPAITPAIRRTAANRKCLGLILHSNYAAGAYRRAGVAEAKILVAHNGAGPRPPGLVPEKAAARAALGLPADRAIVVYAGRVNEEKGLDQLLALAGARPEPLFLLVGSEGDGPIEAAAAAHANVRIVPWQAPADAARLAERRRRAAHPALARAARDLPQLRAAAEALRLSRRRPGDPRAGRARHRRAARRRRQCPARAARRYCSGRRARSIAS